MRMIRLILTLTAATLLLSGCRTAVAPRVSVPVLMGDVVPCVSCQEDVEPVDGCCPICGARLPS